MSGINEQVRIFLNNIQNDINVEGNLFDLKVALAGLRQSQQAEIVRNCQLSTLFDCLNSSNNNQIILTCDVLKIILPALPVAQLINDNSSALIRALGHPMREVKEVILDEMVRAAGDESLLQAVEQDVTFMAPIGKCLCHEDVSVGKRAVAFFIKLGQTKRGLAALCQPVFIKKLIESIGNNSIYVLRIFEVLVDLSSKSEDALKYLEKEGLLDRISSFLRSDDVLAMLALVELCTKMALTPHGWDFLCRHGVIKHLVEMFSSYADSPLSSLTFPGLSKFFGQIGQTKPKVLVELYPEVLSTAFSAVDSDDLNIFIPALELIGTIAYSPQGKCVLKNQDERLMRHVMGRLYESMTKLPTEWRVRALHTVANIVHVENKYCTTEYTRLCETWFNQLGIGGLSTIHELATQPFTDLKAAALLVLLQLANQRWSQNKIYEANNILNFLLNRRTENEAEGLQMKYDILKAIVESKTGESTFDREEYEAILEYVRRGPFYAAAGTEIAIEGEE